MFIVIDHEIHDATTFQQRAEKAFPLPSGLQVHFFLPANDFSRAVCLYEAPSVDAVRTYVDGLLGDSCTNRYVPVAEDHAMGLPRKHVA